MSAPNSSASPSFIPSLQGGSYSNASSPLVNVQSIAQGFNGQPQFLSRKKKKKNSKFLLHLFLLEKRLKQTLCCAFLNINMVIL